MISDLGNGIAGALKGFFEKKGEEEKLLNEAVRGITTSLLASNISTRITLGVKQRILERYKEKRVGPAGNREKQLQSIVFEELCAMIDPKRSAFAPKKGEVSVVLFVGLQGSGKTTSCCKYAKYYKARGFKVGIICADTFRAGAYDQVKQNVEKIDLKVFISSRCIDPVEVAKEGCEALRKEGCNLILIDTSGRHTQEGELFKEMENIVQVTSPTATIFVVDASIGQAAEVHAKGFMSRVDVGSVIITKTDGTKNIGGALSSIAETRTPVAFIGTGEGMGELEPFNPRGFVSKLMGLGDMSALADKLEGMELTEEKQEELIGKIKAGEFSMGDFYEQYKKILEMGPISQLMSLIPGMNAGMLDEKSFRRMGTIFSAMTKKELKTNGEVFVVSTSKVVRVAKGSGATLSEVKATISMYRTMSQMLKKIMANPMFGGMLGGMLGGNARDPPSPAAAKAQMDQLKKMMPPGMSSLFDQFGKFM